MTPVLDKRKKSYFIILNRTIRVSQQVIFLEINLMRGTRGYGQTNQFYFTIWYPFFNKRKLNNE